MKTLVKIPILINVRKTGKMSYKMKPKFTP